MDSHVDKETKPNWNRQEIGDIKLGPIGKELSDKLREKLRKPKTKYPEIYGFKTPEKHCFSCDSDSLSQWRAYGGGESGFAIGFDSTKLGQCNEPSFLLRECIYDEDAQIKIALDIINDLLTGSIDPSLENMISVLFSIAPLMKNKSFCDEKEWRLEKNKE